MSSNEALREHAELRSKEVVTRVKRAQREMESDIEKHDGIYPYNSGNLTLSEVCRRAGVHKVTLQGKVHKTSTRKDVLEWLAATRARLITGNRVVRATVAKRADDWKALYLDVARNFNMAKLEVIAKDERIEELEAEVARLREELSVGKVVRMSGRNMT